MSASNQGIDPSAQRYQMIPRTLIFITHNDYVLFLKGAPHKQQWPNRYNGIGGHVERGESIWDAALREIREEAGLRTIENLALRGVISIDLKHPNPGIIIFVFTGESETHSTVASSEGTLDWRDWKSIPAHEMVDDLPDLLPRLFNGDLVNPFLAHYTYDADNHLHIEFS